MFEEGDIFRITVPLDDSYSYDASIGAVAEDSHRTFNHNEQAIINLMKANPKITITELSATTGLSTSGVKYH